LVELVETRSLVELVETRSLVELVETPVPDDKRRSAR